MALFLVANRLPVSVERRKGKLHLERSAGGLVTALSAFHATHESSWIGWPGIARERVTDKEWHDLERKLRVESRELAVSMGQQDVDAHYFGFCNATLWPLFHYFSQDLSFQRAWWEGYKRVNGQFADLVLAHARRGDTVWIHDFQLMLLPGMLRERAPDLSIGFFLHIPFPSFEILRLLPWREDMVRGMLGSDLIGFHTYDYAIHFLKSVQRFLGIEHEGGRLSVGTRSIKVDAFPLGIDADRFAKAVEEPPVQRRIKRLRDGLGNRTVILSIDRLDYTKGIAQRLRAFQELLQRRQDLRGKVTLLLVTVPSRTKVERYRAMKREIDELVGAINGAHGTMEWTPVHYLYRSLDFRELAAFYAVADIALVTPLRDGMNLISKEYVASKGEDTGILILSEMAGSAKELHDAIITNPASADTMTDALEEAIMMPPEEAARRFHLLRATVRRRDTAAWANDFLENLRAVKQGQSEALRHFLQPADRTRMIRHFRESKNRLLLLDYDGTLRPYARTPKEAWPSKPLLELLTRLAADPHTRVVLLSGRKRRDLEEWFQIPGLKLIAEHGMWIRKNGGDWTVIEALGNEWKDEVRPMLERFVITTPGSFLEEKEYSLAWHNLLVDPELRSVRTRELMSFLPDMIRNLPVDLREGHRIVEVKHRSVDKGRAVQYWLLDQEPDFVFSAGDDWTDEDMFAAVPEGAYTLKVGPGSSRARWRVHGPDPILSILRDFAEKSDQSHAARHRSPLRKEKRIRKPGAPEKSKQHFH